MRDGANIVGTPDGVFRTGDIRREVPDRRWSADVAVNSKGTPKHPDPEKRPGPPPTFAKHAMPISSSTVTFAAPQDTEAPRANRLYILKQDIEEHGATPGCPGCEAAARGIRARHHSESCRKRMEEEIGKTEEGRSRLEMVAER